MSNEEIADDWETDDAPVETEQMRRALKEQERARKNIEKLNALTIASATASTSTKEEEEDSDDDDEEDGDHGKVRIMRRQPHDRSAPVKKECSMTEEERREARAQSYAQARDRIFGNTSQAESTSNADVSSSAASEKESPAVGGKKKKKKGKTAEEEVTQPASSTSKSSTRSLVEMSSTERTATTPNDVPTSSASLQYPVVDNNQPISMRPPVSLAAVRSPLTFGRPRQPMARPTMYGGGGGGPRAFHYVQQPPMFMPPQQAYYPNNAQYMPPPPPPGGTYGCPPPFMHHASSSPSLQDQQHYPPLGINRRPF